VESNNNLPEIKACGGGICGRTVIAIPCKTRARGQGLGSKCDVIEGAVPAKPARGGHRQASVVRRHLGPIPSIPPPPRAQGRQVGDASCVRRSRHGNPPPRPLANCDCAPRLHFTLTLDCPSGTELCVGAPPYRLPIINTSAPTTPGGGPTPSAGVPPNRCRIRNGGRGLET
jgi:hypothetical protein